LFGRVKILVVGLLLLVSASAFAETKFYRLEVGAQAGMGYYMGELSPCAFVSVSEVYGAQVRAKIDQRWSLQVKGQRQRVINQIEVSNVWGLTSGVYVNPMWHFDATAEFNFFRFGLDPYNIHTRSLTPFMFVGVGFTAYNKLASQMDSYPMSEITAEGHMGYAMYIPVGVGLKWKFAERWQLQMAWQHNLYMVDGDGLEGIKDLNDSYGLNGSNVMNNDVTSTITVGLVFELAADKKICPFCKD
jgi:hypothetical protein